MTGLIAVVKTLNGGWDGEAKEMSQEGFKLNESFVVTSIDMSGFTPYVNVKGKEKAYNSVFFKFLDAKSKEEVSIYSDTRFVNKINVTNSA